MSNLLFDPAPQHSLAVVGEDARYPIHRIFCVGRNYAAHAAEMGDEVDRSAPWYFTKSAQAYCPSGSAVTFPSQTEDYHHEMELVIALGAEVFEANLAQAEAAIYGYGCGLDMTRRDLQAVAKSHRRPWSLGKDVENSAVMAALTKAGDFGSLQTRRIHLSVNGDIRQDSTLGHMVWSPAEIVSHLSKFYHLRAGDLILSGTPEGVGPVDAGDTISGGIDGLSDVELKLV